MAAKTSHAAAGLAMPLQLEDFGWDASWQTELDALRAGAGTPGELTPARVVRAEAIEVDVWSPRGELTVHLPARRRRGEERPAVGDWVIVTTRDEQEPRLATIMNRRTCFARRAAGRRTDRQIIATNVDVVFVVSSLDGDFSMRRLERYLTAVADSGAEPVILLTKAGQHEDLRAVLNEARSAAPGVPVHPIDVVDGVDPGAGDSYLRPRTTVALVGSSGVGKSTLVNHWLGETRQQTAPVRQRDRRGQHTTVARELFHLDHGAMVIDTPGMRELALWVDPAALDQVFPDIDRLAAHCRFSNCRHETEPQCAVVMALESGDLDPARLQSYRDLRAEILQAEAKRRQRGRR